MNKTVRLAGIAYESLVNGPGMRRVFLPRAVNISVKVALIQKHIVLMVEKLWIWIN